MVCRLCSPCQPGFAAGTLLLAASSALAMPTPQLGMTMQATFGVLLQPMKEFETPIQFRYTLYFATTAYNAAARYDAVALDAWTKEAPADRQPVEAHSEVNRMAAIIASFYHTSLWLLPGSSPALLAAAAKFGVNVTGTEDPIMVGMNAAAASMAVAADDGWNAAGRYEDTIGYFPSNAPWGPVQHPDRWAPLKEQDGRGFAFWQQHVTPHIGFTAKSIVLTAEERATMRTYTPNYDLEEEARLAIERTALTAENDTRKMLIEFFDSKLDVFLTLVQGMAGMFSWGLWDLMTFLIGYEACGYDVVHLVWKDKVLNDHIRPTTVVQERLADETFQTYAGPGNGLGSVKGKDWHPYIRVMPHAEHPSGSSCICANLAQYVMLHHNSSMVPLKVTFPAGSSKVEPGVTPASEMEFMFQTPMEWDEVCAESRLWGGMHFTEAIGDGAELCRPIAEKGYAFMKYLTSGGVEGNAFMDADAGDRSYQYMNQIKLVAADASQMDCDSDGASRLSLVFPFVVAALGMLLRWS